jgi:hypothetical protein
VRHCMPAGDAKPLEMPTSGWLNPPTIVPSKQWMK